MKISSLISMDFWIDLWVSIAEQGLLCYVLNDICKNRNGLGNCFFFFFSIFCVRGMSERTWLGVGVVESGSPQIH